MGHMKTMPSHNLPASDLKFVFVPCETSPGLFDSEVAITITNTEGKKVSLFVDRSLIKNNGTEELFKAQVIGGNSSEVVLLLPNESFEDSSRFLRVPTKDVRV